MKCLFRSLRPVSPQLHVDFQAIFNFPHHVLIWPWILQNRQLKEGRVLTESTGKSYVNRRLSSMNQKDSYILVNLLSWDIPARVILLSCSPTSLREEFFRIVFDIARTPSSPMWFSSTSNILRCLFSTRASARWRAPTSPILLSSKPRHSSFVFARSPRDNMIAPSSVILFFPNRRTFKLQPACKELASALHDFKDNWLQYMYNSWKKYISRT